MAENLSARFHAHLVDTRKEASRREELDSCRRNDCLIGKMNACSIYYRDKYEQSRLGGVGKDVRANNIV